MSPAWIAAFLALAALNLALVGVVLGVVRRALAVLEGGQSAPLMAQDGPPPGTPLPAFEGSTLDGRRVESSELLGEPAVLLFLAEGCEACDTLVLAMRSVRLRLTAARLLTRDTMSHQHALRTRLLSALGLGLFGVVGAVACGSGSEAEKELKKEDLLPRVQRKRILDRRPRPVSRKLQVRTRLDEPGENGSPRRRSVRRRGLEPPWE